MSELERNNDLIDLGSDPAGENFDPFAEDTADNNNDTSAAVPQEPKPEAAAPPVTDTEVPTPANNAADSTAKAVESKEVESPKEVDAEKPPVFEYAGATENIDDTSKTFDELRIEKSADFPELEDGKRVSWTVEYGKITKTVPDPKGTSIGKMKSDIETSKEFATSLKRAKDKNPVCKIKPRVTAQSKGIAYKAVFTNMREAEAADKVISVLPAKDGKVYEMRNNALGRFITPISGCEMLSDVKAGFSPALGIPRIPLYLTMRIITFFRYFTRHGADNEVLVNVYWDKEHEKFVVDAPEQVVSKISVESKENIDFSYERYIHYMDIHSHNSMKAFFSATDDNDEKATRLYTVIGRLDQYFPEIKTRISNGGKFHEINPAEVFDYIEEPFPEAWKEKVRFRAPHNIAKGADAL